jgi:hypothetical protein
VALGTRGGGEGSTTYLWLQVAVDEVVAMHALKPFDYLGCYPTRLALRKLPGEMTL